jgi:hypothetical protein
MEAWFPAQNRLQEVKLWLAVFLACWPLAAQDRFAKFELHLHNLAPGRRAAIIEYGRIESGRVVWRNGKIAEAACETPVIAERIPRALLNTSAPAPPGATIGQVLDNTADGTPGEEVLENLAFVDALKPIARVGRLPDAVRFAGHEHQPLGWFQQRYDGRDIRWCHGPSVLIVQVEVTGEKRLALVVSGDTPVEAGNIARSDIALAFFKDVAGLQVSLRDEWIAQALAEFYRGRREASAQLVHQALEKFPELESMPDVSLLYLFAQLRLPETEASATAVIRDHPSLPTAWFYYGDYLENSKRYREAAACFEKITMHQPPWHNWTVVAARKELTYLKTY